MKVLSDQKNFVLQSGRFNHLNMVCLKKKQKPRSPDLANFQGKLFYMFIVNFFANPCFPQFCIIRAKNIAILQENLLFLL